jgi:predicted secreted hydrolase
MKTSQKRLSIPHLVDAERDLAFKPGLNANSFFVIADMESAEGQKFNILIHQLQVPAPADVPMKMLSIFNVLDITNGIFKSDEILYPEEEVSYETDRLYVETPTSTISGDLHAIHATADFEWGSVKLSMQFPGEVIYNAGAGVFDFFGNMPTGQCSIVKGLGSGTLKFQGREIKLFGKTWFDRQWSWRRDLDGNEERPMTVGFQEQDMYWTWMNLTLDNGEALGLWDINLYGKHASWVTLVKPDGSQLVANIRPLAEAAGDYWTSPTGQRYPTSWVVDIADLNASLIVKSIKKEQEVPSAILPKYEGLAEIGGTYERAPVTGYTLVEMVGNWNKDRKI